MTYAQVTDDTITAIGRLPKAARRMDTGEWIIPHDGMWTVAEHESAGWFEIVDTPRPDDTATDTHDRAVELVAGVPTVVWTQRAKTQAELDADTAQELDTTTRDQARTAFDANKTYLASTPTTAEALGQVDALTRQINGLIKLVVDAGLVE